MRNPKGCETVSPTHVPSRSYFLAHLLQVYNLQYGMYAPAAKQAEKDSGGVNQYPDVHAAVVVEAVVGSTADGAGRTACWTACMVVVYQLSY